MTAPLPTAILPLLQAQHDCFGHLLEGDPACSTCLVRSLCAVHKERLLADFSQEWERYQRLGARSEHVALSSVSPCQHCKRPMRPEDGKVLCIEGKGTYHTRCVDLAFPPRPE